MLGASLRGIHANIPGYRGVLHHFHRTACFQWVSGLNEAKCFWRHEKEKPAQSLGRKVAAYSPEFMVPKKRLHILQMPIYQTCDLCHIQYLIHRNVALCMRDRKRQKPPSEPDFCFKLIICSLLWPCSAQEIFPVSVLISTDGQKEGHRQ